MQPSEFMTVEGVSQYLNIKRSTIYSKIHQIPHYKVGKLLRFRKSDIDLWMEGKRKECVASEKVARKILGLQQKSKIDIERVVRKSIDEAKGQGYTIPHGKPDRYQGPREGGL